MRTCEWKECNNNIDHKIKSAIYCDTKCAGKARRLKDRQTRSKKFMK